MAKREQVFHQFLRPLKGIGLPVNYDITMPPNYESEIAFDRERNKFLFSIEQNEGQEDFKWITISRSRTVVNVTNNYSIDSDDYLVLADASANNITILLPSAAEANENEIHIKKIDTTINSITLQTQNGELIDGITSYSIYDSYVTINVISNGTAWYLI